MIITLTKAEGQIDTAFPLPPGVTVVIRDYDIVPDHFHPNDLDFDEEGRAYVKILWGPEA